MPLEVDGEGLTCGGVDDELVGAFSAVAGAFEDEVGAGVESRL